GMDHVDAKTVYSPAPIDDPTALIYAQSGALELGSSCAELIYTDSGAALRLTTPRCTILDVTEISPFDELPQEVLCDLLIIDGAFADAPAALRYLCSLAKPSVVYITAADCDLPRLEEICSCEVIWLDDCQRVKIN
ncbi:MAG: hypothetical protein J6Q16_00745, partial [Clostridia bacterium]|nr:hypothetical protein [Clostridia bacterium]